MFFITLGFSLFILAIILLIMAPVYAAQNKRRTEETAGYITEVRKTYSRKGGTSYRIDFEYTVNGERQLLKNVKWTYAPEETSYTICCNPNKPEDAHVKEFRSPLIPKAFAITGAILIVVSMVLIVVGAVRGS